jgi:hypothetical protein
MVDPPASGATLQLSSSSDVTDVAPGIIPMVPFRRHVEDSDSLTVQMVPISARIRPSANKMGCAEPKPSECCLLL